LFKTSSPASQKLLETSLSLLLTLDGASVLEKLGQLCGKVAKKRWPSSSGGGF